MGGISFLSDEEEGLAPIEVETKSGESLSEMLRAAARSLGGPIRVPSSRYQQLRERSGISDLKGS